MKTYNGIAQSNRPITLRPTTITRPTTISAKRVARARGAKASPNTVGLPRATYDNRGTNDKNNKNQIEIYSRDTKSAKREGKLTSRKSDNNKFDLI
ncbi:hypothetical protein PUN28_001346 [Cardiocondyla obscurior]|uniref:Uncharacterized protein n=1 Tax=Cardiocondyla obscurior TaxID=286306 RepID=A0AAW2H4F7_9HYME